MIQYNALGAGMAQLVEQLIRNQQVAGSSPATSSKGKDRFRMLRTLKDGF